MNKNELLMNNIKIKEIIRNYLKIRSINKLLNKKNHDINTKKYSTDFCLKGEYLISTDKGVFLAKNDYMENVFPYNTFGISVDQNNIYMAVSEGDMSCVLKGELHFKKNKLVSIKKLKKIYNIKALYHNERIHQIHAKNGRLVIANTAKNAITILNSANGEQIVEIYPFSDFTGCPIKKDHNHINSVLLTENMILFTAHDGGKLGSLLGYISDTSVKTWAYKNRGVHDIIPTTSGIIFSDTFGDNLNDFMGGGALVINGNKLKLVNDDIGHMVRGIAGTGDEMLVGSSFMGKRLDRFQGHGGILLLNNYKIIKYQKMAFAQVHDIIRLDGNKLDENMYSFSEKEIIKSFSASLGSACLEKEYYIMKSDELYQIADKNYYTK